MAGRGRGATLPAWMTSGSAVTAPTVSQDIPTNNQFNEPTNVASSDNLAQDRSTRKSSRDRGERSREVREDRDRDRERRRGSRSRSR